MRSCYSCHGVGKIIYEDEEEDCLTCNGTGKVEDGCHCYAREPFECCCGGWDDVDIDEWYGELKV